MTNYGTYTGRVRPRWVAPGLKRASQCEGCGRYRCNCDQARCVTCRGIAGSCGCKVCKGCKQLVRHDGFQVTRHDKWGGPVCLHAYCDQCRYGPMGIRRTKKEMDQLVKASWTPDKEWALYRGEGPVTYATLLEYLD